MLPKLEKNRESLNNYFGTKSVDGEYLDPEFVRLLNDPESETIVDKLFK